MTGSCMTGKTACPSLPHCHQQCLAPPVQSLCSPCKRCASSWKRPKALCKAAQRQSGGDGDAWQQLSRIADKYVLGSSAASSKSGPLAAAYPLRFQGIHFLLCSLVVVYLLTTSNSCPVTVKLLSLENTTSKWWSVVTDAFVSPTIDLLARNLFFGYMFGRVIQNSESGKALWLTYLTSAGGGAAAWLLLPKRAALQGCSNTGAMFGLFAMAAVFNRHKLWHWHRLFELAVLLPFVCQQLLASHASISQYYVIQGYKTGAWVPLLGGFVGAAVAAAILALVRLVQGAKQQKQGQQQQLGIADAKPPGEGSPAGADATSVLLSAALKQLLRRVL